MALRIQSLLSLVYIDPIVDPFDLFDGSSQPATRREFDTWTS